MCMCVCRGYVLLVGIGFRLEALSIPFSLGLHVCVRGRGSVVEGLLPAERNECFWKNVRHKRKEKEYSAGKKRGRWQ